MTNLGEGIGQKMYTDERGFIHEICKNADVMRIISKPGVFRANHYHLTTSHICVPVLGRVIYYERTVGSKEKPTRQIFEARSAFYTGPLLEHCMYFDQDTEFYCYSLGSRDQADYEKDLVRLPYNLKEIYDSFN